MFGFSSSETSTLPARISSRTARNVATISERSEVPLNSFLKDTVVFFISNLRRVIIFVPTEMNFVPIIFEKVLKYRS